MPSLSLFDGWFAPSQPPSANNTIDPSMPQKKFAAARTLDQLPGWQAENYLEALNIFKNNCNKLSVQTFDAAKDAALWQNICIRVATVGDNAEQAKNFWQENFTATPIDNGGKDTGLITGYYEAELRGSWRRHGAYRYPLYRVPDDQFLDLTRAEIDAGRLRGKNLELLWVDDPVSVFTLHVQGSGRVLMDDGKAVRVGFAGKNRHPYYSIGKVFAEKNLLPPDQVNMDSIEAWLRANKKSAGEVMAANPSYIFFRRVDGVIADHQGPIGAWGIPLYEGRSIAVDRSIYELGLPFWLDVPHPDGSSAPIQKLVFAHDTGTAIKGAVRADYFFGTGARAKYLAGQMRGRGRMFMITPRANAMVAHNAEK